MDRKLFFKASAAALFGAPFLANAACAEHPQQQQKSTITPLTKSKKEWKKLLTHEQYEVMFEEDTEYPGSSPLNKEKRKGKFVCAACFLPLFDASTKFESGTGWPSFFDVLPGRTARKDDFLMVIPRKEYHCARCGAHQGHVFDDGPQPTGLRYCNNGVALKFVPEGDKLPALRT